MRVCEPGGLGGVEAAVLCLLEEGEGRSVLRVGQARVLPEGGHQGGRAGLSSSGRAREPQKKCKLSFSILGLHVSM